MKNFVEEGKTMNYTVPADSSVKSGEVVALGDRCGIAVTDGAEGETIALAAEGVFELPKGSGAIDQGKKVYLNVAAEGGAKTIVTTASGNTFCGYAHEAAKAADTTVLVKLV